MGGAVEFLLGALLLLEIRLFLLVEVAVFSLSYLWRVLIFYLSFFFIIFDTEMNFVAVSMIWAVIKNTKVIRITRGPQIGFMERMMTKRNVIR